MMYLKLLVSEASAERLGIKRLLPVGVVVLV